MRSLLPLFLLAVVALPAAAINVDSTAPDASLPGACTLRAAIVAANTNQSVGGCAAGVAGHDVIELPIGGRFVIGEIHSAIGARAGLPGVTEPLTIRGHGSVIERDAQLACEINQQSTPSEFRLIHASAALVLEDMALLNGCADSSDAGPGYAPTAYGAGVLLEGGGHVLRRVTLSGHRAYAGSAVAVFDGADDAQVTITDSLVSANHAVLGATAMIVGEPNSGSGHLVLVNSTITGNATAAFPAVMIDGEADLSFVTLADNDSPGLLVNCSGAGCARIRSSVIAGHPNRNCLIDAGDLAALGANLSSDATCPGFSLPATAPGLAPLADNGGPTDTRLPLANSAALDAAIDCLDTQSAPVMADQRGGARPQDGNGDGLARCDLGAAELTGTSVFSNGFE